MINKSRRYLLKLSTLACLIGSTIAGCRINGLLKIPTPTEVKGPFYPVEDQTDKDFDLTKVDGRDGIADGQHIIVLGH
ncbi:MAG: protocatechuate 3,4-dioxygenase, partial [Nitrosomonas sp.]|nr:protocatechuate 3,4-dioxygenase [Nitrosomonas sp.]